MFIHTLCTAIHTNNKLTLYHFFIKTLYDYFKGKIMLYLLLLLLFSINTINTCTSKIKRHINPIPKNIECYLGADIGGTQCIFCIFEINNNKPHLILSFTTKTDKISDFTADINNLIEYMYDTYGITINHACIAAPGVATKTRDYASVHGIFEIDSKDLIERTALKTA